MHLEPQSDRPETVKTDAVTAIVLAAGLSCRAAPRNKLLLPAGESDDRPVVRATVEAVVGAEVGPVLVVTGHQREEIEAALTGLNVRFVFAPEFARGIGHSLAAGIRASPADVAGFAIVPGDLPGLTPALVRRVVACFTSEGGAYHVIPMDGGARGHPVVLGAWLRPQLATLTGDVGARHLLAAPGEVARTCFFEVGDPAIRRDVDDGRAARKT